MPSLGVRSPCSQPRYNVWYIKKSYNIKGSFRHLSGHFLPIIWKYFTKLRFQLLKRFFFYIILQRRVFERINVLKVQLNTFSLIRTIWMVLGPGLPIHHLCMHIALLHWLLNTGSSTYTCIMPSKLSTMTWWAITNRNILKDSY